MKKLAILILNYNGYKKLGSYFFRCIESAKNIKYPADIYLIDNASTDKSIDIIERFDVNLISHDKNYGFVGGFNLAIKKIFQYKMYEFLVLMNNDYIITNNECVSDMINFFDKNKKVISLQCINSKENKKDISDVSGFIDIYFNPIIRFAGYKIFEYPDKLSYVSFNVGAFFALDVKKLVSIGRFPQVFEPYYYWDAEDLEVGFSFWSNGYYCAVLPIEGGIHLEEGTLKRKSFSRQYLISRNRVFCHRKIWKKKPLNSSLKVSLLRNLFFELKFKRKERIRGIFDGLTKDFFYKFNGEYYPLLITPDFKDILNHLLVMRRWMKQIEILSTSFITDNEIKESNLPFLINIKRIAKK
jgi:Predicted glycosyltransferases